jgi:hypothetical protein
MKALALNLLWLLPLALGAAEVRPGDTLPAVKAALGAPNGQVHRRDVQLLYYDRGEIELREGAVTRVALRTAGEQAAWQARNATIARHAEEFRELYRARLRTEGAALKRHKLDDPDFAAAPAAYQVAFWEDFSRRFADISCDDQLAAARLRLAGELATRRQHEQEERLAELELRVRLAEAEAGAFHGHAVYYASYYRGQQAAVLWPIEYHFNDGTAPAAAAVQVQSRNNVIPRHTDASARQYGQRYRL